MNIIREQILSIIRTAEYEGEVTLNNRGDILTAELFPSEDGTHTFIYEYAILEEGDEIVFEGWGDKARKSLESELVHYLRVKVM